MYFALLFAKAYWAISELSMVALHERSECITEMRYTHSTYTNFREESLSIYLFVNHAE